MIVVLALLIGIVAGLRAMTAPAAVSWAAWCGGLDLRHTPYLLFLGAPVTPWVVSLLAAGELVADKLPKTPSRKLPGPFAARFFSGALCGCAVGASGGQWGAGLVAGAIGAVIGTFGGYEGRKRLASAFGRDRPAALLEDAVAIGAAVLAVGLA